jgi:hypothetical protein
MKGFSCDHRILKTLFVVPDITIIGVYTKKLIKGRCLIDGVVSLKTGRHEVLQDIGLQSLNRMHEIVINGCIHALGLKRGQELLSSRFSQDIGIGAEVEKRNYSSRTKQAVGFNCGPQIIDGF